MMWPIRSSSGRRSGGDAARAGTLMARKTEKTTVRSGCMAHTFSRSRSVSMGPK